MRVLMTADTVGGVWTYALELADALCARGVEVALATMGPPPSDEQRAELARSAVVSVEVGAFALEWMDDPWADVERAGDWLLDLAEHVEPDVVHLNGYVHAALPWRAPVLVVGHSCVLSWWRAVRGGEAPPEWERYRVEVERGVHAADLLAAPTRALLDELVRLYRPRCETRAIPNGRSGAPFPPRPKEPFVLAAGRLWDEAKNLAALDRVAPRLPWPVLVTGDGGAGAGVRALGRVPSAELASLLGRASIFAAPARYEPFGLAALEAALAGCALVLGDIPSLREVWGDAALYADPRDDAALEAALRRAIDDEPLRAGLARRARARGLELTPERMAEGYLDAYDRLLAPVAEAAR